MRSLTRPTSKRKGYTMIELAIGLSLTLLLLLLAVTWVATLMRTSAASVELRASSRDAAFAEVRLADDMASARPCAANGTGWSFMSMSDTRVAFWADVVVVSGVPGADGFADLVIWDTQGGSLRRGVFAGSGSCAVPLSSVSSSALIANTALNNGAPTFTAYSPTGSVMSVVDCQVSLSDCDVGSVRLRTVAERNSAADAPTRIDTTATVARVGRWM